MTALSANTLYAAPLPRLDQSYLLTEARADVSSAAAGNLLSGIYRYAKSGTTRLLKLVPGTSATISTAVAGVIKSTLAGTARLSPREQYFAGVIYTSSSPQVVSKRSARGFGVGVLKYTSQTSLPDELDPDIGTIEYPKEYPVVAYLNGEAADVL